MNRIFLTNLGKYNEGELIGKWVELPCADWENELQSIGVSPDPDENGNYYEEYFISDYETDIDGWNIDEYANLEELNELAEKIDSLYEDEEQAVKAFLENGEDLETALEYAKSGNYRIYNNCFDMSDVAYEVVNECGYLSGVPEFVSRYFDYEAFGRDLDIEGVFYYMGGGVYVELIY